jgi:uncharacterized protein YoxC
MDDTSNIDALHATIATLTARVEALTAQGDVLAIEVTRVQGMVQELSESHDRNRRELNHATARTNELAATLVQKTAVAVELARTSAETMLRARADQIRGEQG